MIISKKRSIEDVPAVDSKNIRKKMKKNANNKNNEDGKIQNDDQNNKDKVEKKSKINKLNNKEKFITGKSGKPNGKNFNSTKSSENFEKVEDWTKFKQEKKELRLKRIKARTKDNFDRIQEAKKMSEKVRMKVLKLDERNKLINKLHALLKGHYAKFVLAHDTARIIQWLLKYSSKILVNQISQELLAVTVEMLQSKYGIHCIKRLLKYGDDNIRNNIIDKMKGFAVKLASHSNSAAVMEFAYTNYASQIQKQHLQQEFYGDLYKNSKDPNVKHLKDVYAGNETMKNATLSACKANIKKVLNKSLLDSTLFQSVLNQFLEECSKEDKAELISELASHIVVISNSKDGSKAAMQCIWHGTNKDRKLIMKTLKEHLIELSKHEFGHRTIISLLHSVDDTVLLHKIILSEILKEAKNLAVSEYGRKVLLWLVVPGNSTIFHPQFVKELQEGLDSSNSKKPKETRNSEILSYSIDSLLKLIIEDTNFWMSSSSLAVEMLAIIKAGSDGNLLREVFNKISEIITNVEWKIKEQEDKEIAGIEHAGLHMTLKKLIKLDKEATEHKKPTLGDNLLNHLSKETLSQWVKFNRGCFLLITLWENSEETVQNQLKIKLKHHLKVLKNQSSSGAEILLKKLV